MVEREKQLNSVFGCLSDPTRRDILKRVSEKDLSISEIAAHYRLTFAAVAKHLEVLHHAKLIGKKRRGKEQIINIVPAALTTASQQLDKYQQLWENRLDSLDKYIKSINNNKKGK